jgi:drug/metabolite transporter (DMT)-like permease
MGNGKLPTTCCILATVFCQLKAPSLIVNIRKKDLQNIILFAAAALIWGSTWLVIKFQLGVVDPLVSVSYRFMLAGLILLLYSRIRKLNLRFAPREHGYMVLLGFLLFGINYWLVYYAELSLPSGLVAIVFSSIIFLNIINGAVILRSPVRGYVVLGALIGMSGIILVFKEEIERFDLVSVNSMAFFLAFLGAISASLGNITSAFLQKRSAMPVIQTNAYAMLYGAVFMLIIALVMGKPLVFVYSFPYIASLLYLTVFGSIIAFGSYLTLLGRIGADKAAYATLIIPVIAMILSTIFEGYQWNAWAAAGVILILSGNIIVLRKRHK